MVIKFIKMAEAVEKNPTLSPIERVNLCTYPYFPHRCDFVPHPLQNICFRMASTIDYAVPVHGDNCDGGFVIVSHASAVSYEGLVLDSQTAP
jgi:hypothetical protein